MPQICPHCGATNRDTGRFCSRCRGTLPGILAPGTLVQERYQVVRKLGAGGFGAVYLATDLRLHTQLAIKENFDNSQEAQEQFQREARLLAKLSHPNLPRVTDYFIDPSGRQYLVMDYIAGQDLQDRVDKQGPLPVDLAVKWAGQILDALEYMHTRPEPVIHRDIKPANIRVTPSGRAMLVDFGISKVGASSQRTAIGARAVSPGYSPLEQYGGRRTEARSDVYSLGATLYALLTGEIPPEPTDLLSRQLPLKLSTASSPDIPDHVQATILKAMEQRIEQRFSSAREMKQALTGRSQTLQPASQPRHASAQQWPIRTPTSPGAQQAAYPRAAAPPAAQPVPQQMPYYAQQPAANEIEGVPAGMALAGYGPRIGAALVDSVMVSLISMACVGPPTLIAALLESEEAWVVLSLLGYALALVFTVRYYVRGHSKTGQTLGKKWLKIKVVDQNGALISKGKAFWRFMAFSFLSAIIGAVLVGFGFLVYLIPLIDKRRRALHDMICNTLVVKA